MTITLRGGLRRFLHLIAAGLAIAAVGGAPVIAGDKTENPAQRQERAPLYYQHPDGKPVYALTPKKGKDGRDFVPVYEDESTSAGPPAQQSATPSADKGRILYYRNPMGLPDTSPVPKKDSMSMDYIPVYENEVAEVGIVRVSPGKLQMLGVRTAPVEMHKTLVRSVRATGSVQLDERTLAVVTTKIGGWIESLQVSAVGDDIRRGDPLLQIYSPELVAAEEEYLVASRLTTSHGDGARGSAEALTAAAAQRLRAFGVPENEIARLRQTGKASRAITVRAPINGIVVEKPAVQGMRVESDSVLYRLADLTTVWLVAQVQERDLGEIQKRQRVRASFVAFPERTFEGVVDFVYPTLSAETRTARVRLLMPNPDLMLRENMYATIEIEAPVTLGKSRMLIVPDSAIIDSGAHQIVLIDRGEGRFEPRAVRLGARGDGNREVLEGLKEGQRVVVGANFLIDSESNLRAALQSFTPTTGNPQ